MSIRCPFCSFKIDVKAAPGVYQPKCPKCAESFCLSVPREPEGKVLVAKSVAALKKFQADHAGNGASGERPSELETQAPPAATGQARAGQTAAAAGGDGAEHPRPDGPSQDAIATVAPTGDAGPDRFSAETVADHATRAKRTPVSAGPADPLEPQPGDLPVGERLDGYELVKLIGRGGMGRVYLAKQISLDRLVAVKTIDPRWSRDPAFLARFVREAYAVAQLSHHHVVQIHDIGQAEGVHFFSMEYVEGKSLADVVKEHGKLDPEEAATYILHAARGLKFAHEHHMVHRDVKPSNLLLSDQGLVKVADLGLVKTPAGERDTQLTQAASGSGSGAASSDGGMIGTPAYMAPEQALDAANVDARADVYSLGGTFYQLVTGRPPFAGQDAATLVKQHASEQLAPPEKLAPRLSPSLAEVIKKMLAKQPDERYPTMESVIGALAAHLGVEAGPFTPRPEHSAALVNAVSAFNSAVANRVRQGVIVAFNLVALAAVIVGVFGGHDVLIGTTISLWVFAGVSYQVIVGVMRRTVLMRQTRQYLLSSSFKHWLAAGGGAVAVGAMLVALGLHWVYLGALAGGVVLGAMLFFAIDLWVDRQRKPAVESVREMLRNMRLCGLEEDALRRFVCRYSGRRWEAFYEALFGYEAKIQARRLWGQDLDGRPRPRHAGWRDGLIEWFELRMQEREQDRQRRHLQRLELQRLKAEGMSDLEAAAEARRSVGEIVDRATAYHETGNPRLIGEVVVGKPIEAAEGEIPESWKIKRDAPARRLSVLLIGARGRLVAAGVLLVGWALWARQHLSLPTEFTPNHLRMWLRDHPPALSMQPVPDMVWNVLCSQGALLAGLLLLVSSLFVGRKMTFFILPAVVVLLRAPFLSLQPTEYFGVSQSEIAMVGGVALGLAGLVFGRIRYD